MSLMPARTRSADETTGLGEAFGATLSGGEVIVLSGELGSGKTTFIRGLARGLGAYAPNEVASPSYTIINEHPGRLTLLHVDLYRLHDDQDILELALEDLLHRGAVMAVEWGERLPKGFPVTTRLTFTALTTDEREIRKQDM
jgi:tRNA threonylcarbamoyladenosine biosynthesis protein TsaE